MLTEQHYQDNRAKTELKNMKKYKISEGKNPQTSARCNTRYDRAPKLCEDVAAELSCPTRKLSLMARSACGFTRLLRTISEVSFFILSVLHLCTNIQFHVLTSVPTACSTSFRCSICLCSNSRSLLFCCSIVARYIKSSSCFSERKIE